MDLPSQISNFSFDLLDLDSLMRHHFFGAMAY